MQKAQVFLFSPPKPSAFETRKEEEITSPLPQFPNTNNNGEFDDNTPPPKSPKRN